MFEEWGMILAGLGPMGIVGLFFISIIGNASLFLPVPVDVIVLFLAPIDFLGLGIITPLIIGVVSAFGASIGEFSGYLVGLAGIKSIEKMKKKEVDKLNGLKKKLEEVGIPLIAFFSFTPLPFDLIGIAAGLARYSKKKFFIGCLIGRVPRYIILSYAGYFGISFLMHFFGG